MCAGGQWARSFRDAILSPFNRQQPCHTGDPEADMALQPDNEFYRLLFNLYLMTYYQATNITEAYMTQKHMEAIKIHHNQDQTFDLFFKDALNFACGKGYQIKDFNIFKQVVKSFFFCAQKEYENILTQIHLN